MDKKEILERVDWIMGEIEKEARELKPLDLYVFPRAVVQDYVGVTQRRLDEIQRLVDNNKEILK